MHTTFANKLNIKACFSNGELKCDAKGKVMLEDRIWKISDCWILRCPFSEKKLLILNNGGEAIFFEFDISYEEHIDTYNSWNSANKWALKYCLGWLLILWIYVERLDWYENLK